MDLSSGADAAARTHLPPPGTAPDPLSDAVLSVLALAADHSSGADALRAALMHSPGVAEVDADVANLVRALGIAPGHRVLELGARFGALTRYLGEQRALVVAVEGDRARAQGCRLRCADLPNVIVIDADNAQGEVPRGPYDWIVMAGTLAQWMDPVRQRADLLQLLQQARQLLEPHGELVLAVDNAFALGRPSRCDDAGSGRLGRQEWLALLKQAGFTWTAVSALFPQARRPRLIVHEAACLQQSFDPGRLVQDCDFGGQVALPWAAASRNGLLLDLADAFLIRAATEDRPRDDALARWYSSDRSPAMACETVFAQVDEVLQVSKKPLAPVGSRTTDANGGAAGQACVRPRAATQPYRAAPTLHSLLAEAVAAGDRACVSRLMARYDALLQTLPLSPAFIEVAEAFDCRIVAGAAFDATPKNLLVDDDELIAIDDEWDADFDMPLTIAPIRYLRYTPSLAALPALFGCHDLASVLPQLLPVSARGLHPTDLQLEHHLSTLVGAQVYAWRVPMAPGPDALTQQAQQRLDAGDATGAARLLALGFAITRHWPLANDAALLRALAGDTVAGLRLYLVATTVCSRDAHDILDKARQYLQTVAVDRAQARRLWAVESWPVRLPAAHGDVWRKLIEEGA